MMDLLLSDWLLLLGLLVTASHLCVIIVVARWLWHSWRGGGGTAGDGLSSTVPPPPTAAGGPQQVTVKPADLDSLEKIVKKLMELEKLLKEKRTSESESAGTMIVRLTMARGGAHLEAGLGGGGRAGTSVTMVRQCCNKPFDLFCSVYYTIASINTLSVLSVPSLHENK